MSPAAQRLLIDRSRWWLHDDGGLAFQIAAGPDEHDALAELWEVTAAMLGLDLVADDPGDPVELPDGPGLTFHEIRARCLGRSS